MRYEAVWSFDHMGGADGFTLPYSDDSFEYSLLRDHKKDAHVTMTLYDRDGHYAIDQISTHLKPNDCQQ
jgi:hypothetical protein